MYVLCSHQLCYQVHTILLYCLYKLCISSLILSLSLMFQSLNFHSFLSLIYPSHSSSIPSLPLCLFHPVSLFLIPLSFSFLPLSFFVSFCQFRCLLLSSLSLFLPLITLSLFPSSFFLSLSPSLPSSLPHILTFLLPKLYQSSSVLLVVNILSVHQLLG